MIRSSTQRPTESGIPTNVSLLRMTTPTLRSGWKATIAPKAGVPPLCQKIVPFGVCWMSQPSA